jgi:hypothetical protein
MKSYFSATPFGKFDLSRESWKPAAGRSMGASPQYDFSILSDILAPLGVKESDVTSLIGKLPAEMTPEYRKRLEDCRAEGLTTSKGAACLLVLYNDMKKAAAAAPVPLPPPQPSTFPVVPVLIVGIAAAGLAWFFMRDSKKAASK